MGRGACLCAASAASASVVSLWMHDAPSGVGVGWVVLSTRYHVCSLTAAELQHRQLPALATRDHPTQTQRTGVRRQAPRQRAHATTTHSRVSRSTDFYYRSPARPKPHTIGSHRTKSLPFLLTLDSHQLRLPSSRAREVITRRGDFRASAKRDLAGETKRDSASGERNDPKQG